MLRIDDFPEPLFPISSTFFFLTFSLALSGCSMASVESEIGRYYTDLQVRQPLGFGKKSRWKTVTTHARVSSASNERVRESLSIRQYVERSAMAPLTGELCKVTCSGVPVWRSSHHGHKNNLSPESVTADLIIFLNCFKFKLMYLFILTESQIP